MGVIFKDRERLQDAVDVQAPFGVASGTELCAAVRAMGLDPVHPRCHARSRVKSPGWCAGVPAVGAATPDLWLTPSRGRVTVISVMRDLDDDDPRERT